MKIIVGLSQFLLYKFKNSFQHTLNPNRKCGNVETNF